MTISEFKSENGVEAIEFFKREELYEGQQYHIAYIQREGSNDLFIVAHDDTINTDTPELIRMRLVKTDVVSQSKDKNVYDKYTFFVPSEKNQPSATF